MSNKKSIEFKKEVDREIIIFALNAYLRKLEEFGASEKLIDYVYELLFSLEDPVF